MTTENDWTGQEYELYNSIQASLIELQRHARFLPEEYREQHKGKLKGLFSNIEKWREIMVHTLEQSDTDAFQLQRARDALFQTIVSMFATAAEHDVSGMDGHARNVIHMIKERVVYPEGIPCLEL